MTYLAKTIFRIDDRLIHGQVIEGWVRNLNLTRITIVSDAIKKDENYVKMLEFSVPQEIKVDIFTMKEMAEEAAAGYFNQEDTIVLFESPDDVLGLIDYGCMIDLVHVGCLHYDGNNYQIRSSVAVCQEDIRIFEDINSMGTIIECQSLPQDKACNLMELIGGIE
ncbi:MAG: PTS sugar transporter subunit IIB [Elusimicrobiota bacterium]